MLYRTITGPPDVETRRMMTAMYGFGNALGRNMQYPVVPAMATPDTAPAHDLL
jgi:hypothetical protein